MCECDVCQRTQRIESVKNSNDPEEMKRLINELHGLILNLEMDNDHFAAVLRGEWPRSEEILSRALESITSKKVPA